MRRVHVEVALSSNAAVKQRGRPCGHRLRQLRLDMTQGVSNCRNMPPKRIKRISPEQLLREAEAEPSRRELEDCWPAVVKLREKGLSWREISAWLAKRGIELHHSLLHKHSQKLAVAELAAEGIELVEPEGTQEDIDLADEEAADR